MRSSLKTTISILLPLLVLVGACLVRLFLAQGFVVPSASMSPTLLPGDYILVTPYRHSKRPACGDIVVFRSGQKASPFFVKRIIGLPGDYLQLRGDQVVINGYTLPEPYLTSHVTAGAVMPQIIPQDTFFVLGDNRAESLDSRSLGLVPRETIVGRARLIYWSTSKLGRVMHPIRGN